MKDFRDWHVQENWWNQAQQFAQNVFNPQQQGQGQGQAQNQGQNNQGQGNQQPQQLHPDDPKAKEQKYKKFKSILSKEFFAHVSISGPAHAQIERSLDNISKAMTLGYRLHIRDIDEILVALHTTQGLSDLLTGHTYADHYRVLSFIKQIFDHNPEVWYNPQSQTPEGRMPPGTTISNKELETYMNQWDQSPFRKRAKPQGQNQPQITGAPKTAQELVEWIKKSFTNPQKIAGQKVAQPVSKFKGILYEEDWDLLAREMGKLFNITLTDQELNQLRGIN